MHLPVLLWCVVGRGLLVAKTIVLLRETLALLLESLDVAVTALNLFLQATNLTDVTSLVETSTLDALGAGLSLHGLVLLLETENVENKDVGAVEDERQEEGETAEVQVTLGVELAGLDLHTLRAHSCSTVNCVSLDSQD